MWRWIEFKRKYRCSRPMLNKIVEMIETNDIFTKGARGPKQIPVKHQLMLLLHFLGKEGDLNASQQNQFKVSYGTCEKCWDRVVQSGHVHKYGGERRRRRENFLKGLLVEARYSIEVICYWIIRKYDHLKYKLWWGRCFFGVSEWEMCGWYVSLPNMVPMLMHGNY